MTKRKRQVEEIEMVMIDSNRTIEDMAERLYAAGYRKVGNMITENRHLRDSLFIARNAVNYYLEELKALDKKGYEDAYERFKQAMRKAKDALKQGQSKKDSKTEN